MTIPATRFYRTIPEDPTVKLLSPGAQVLLAALYWHLNRQTGQLNPRHEMLARELRMSVSSIRRHFRSLRDAGIVAAVRRRRAWGYAIRPVEEWRPVTRCRPRAQKSRVVNCDYSQMESQDSASLYERETVLLKEKSVAAAEKSRSCEAAGGRSGAGGGGASPAAGHKQKNNPGAQDPRSVAHKAPGRATTSNGSPSEPASPEAMEKAAEIVEELAKVHPTPGPIRKAVEEIARVLDREPEADFRSSHAAFRQLWAGFRSGRFIPQLWRWVADGDWRLPPDDKTIKTNESEEARARRSRERRQREIEESIDRMGIEELKFIVSEPDTFPAQLPLAQARLAKLRRAS